MNVWLVNPFDPLPGDPEQEGRYATLARALDAAGHHVTWFTSAFSHRFKRPVDQAAISAACRACGIDAVFLSAPAYRTNVSVGRLVNHYILTRDFARQAAAIAQTQPPSIVLASAPPPGLALAAIRFAHSRHVRAVIDVQDLWPETFFRLTGPLARPLLRLALAPMQRTAAKAYSQADAIVGVAEGYVQRALELSGSHAPTAVIPLGVDLAAFDAAALAGRNDRHRKPPGHIWLAYTGSLSRSYDCMTVLEGFLQSRDAFKTRGLTAKLFISGQGEMKDALVSRIAQAGDHEQVEMVGFLEFPQWAYLLDQCDIGFNSNFPQAMIFLPNKIFYYLAAGLAVLNTIAGQSSRIVSQGRAGLDYVAGNVETCREAICSLIEDPAKLESMKVAARTLAQTQYDRKILYAQFVNLLVAQTIV